MLPLFAALMAAIASTCVAHGPLPTSMAGRVSGWAAATMSGSLQLQPATRRIASPLHLKRLRGGEGQVPSPFVDAKTHTVAFSRLAKLREGEVLYVVGDAASLGFNDATKAVAMTKGTDGAWTAEVKDVPEGIAYQYFASIPGDKGGKEEPRFMTGYKLYFDPPASASGVVARDDTKQLVRFAVNKGCSEMSVVGSIPQLGDWKLSEAPKMKRVGSGDSNRWELTLSIPSDLIDTFQYKFCADGSFEGGKDRFSDLFFVEPQPESAGMVSTLESVFEGLLCRFLIFHPIGPDERMVITGSHPGLGDWKPVDNPRRMGLGTTRTLLTGLRDRCWEATFPATLEDVEKVTYRYIIVNDKLKTAVWESEPNRFIQTFPGSASTSGQYRQREFTQFDGNFVAKQLTFDWVPPNMFVGPYPQSREDVQKMKEAGVTGVMNVQTEEDCHKRQINMELMQKYYDEAGIELCRVPILDFHKEDLTKRVGHASNEVNRMVRNRKHEGKEGKVYIHCTAGMGRAPAVACIYLVHRHGYKLEDAMAHVKHHRPSVAPNKAGMEEAIRNGLGN